jgi:hypothetical protein
MLTLILLKLKQRTCEWRGEIAKKALIAVHIFFSDYKELISSEARAEYVAWAISKAIVFLTRIKGSLYLLLYILTCGKRLQSLNLDLR